MLIKWKITLSRWLWQSIGGESRNFWSITIPALFESSVEHLITLLGASSRTKALATVQRFFRALMESIALYALFGSYSKIFDHNIRHRVSVSLWHMYPEKWLDTFVEVSFRVIKSISPRKLSASNSTLFSASPLCLEFWQIDRCQITHSPGSRFQYFLWRISWLILGNAHHSSGDTCPKSSPLDHTAVSLSKQTDIVHAEVSQLDSWDIVRYMDQCCNGLKWQSESFTIEDFLMLPRIEPITKGLQKLRFAII